MLKINYTKMSVIICIFTIFMSSQLSARDWSKKSSWLRESAKMECDEMQPNMRVYYEGQGYKSDLFGITYCNQGGYVIKKVRMKVIRQTDGAVIYRGEKGQNITRGYGHYFIFDIGMSNSGETLKMEIQYNIATGDKRKCTKTFVYNYEDVIWMTKSEGTKWGNNGCKTIKFEQDQ